MSSSQNNKKQTTNDEETLLLEEYEKVQEKLENLSDKLLEEVIQLETKYNKEKRPFYQQRNNIIKKIQNFWKTCFENHLALKEFFEKEMEILDYLEELDVEDFDNSEGYRITLKFKENPYFKNQALMKEFKYDKEGNLNENVSSIDWKEKKFAKSFSAFSDWFSKTENTEDNEENTIDPISEIIKEELWSNLSQYYIGTNNDGKFEEGLKRDVPTSAEDIFAQFFGGRNPFSRMGSFSSSRRGGNMFDEIEEDDDFGSMFGRSSRGPKKAPPIKRNF
jgi:template-activating factor I